MGVVYKAPQKVILTDPGYPSASRCFSDFVWQISDRLESNAHHHTRFMRSSLNLRSGVDWLQVWKTGIFLRERGAE
jgi:hypothetical protein